MTWLDRRLQRWRVRMALRELPPVTRLLDIGTHDGTVFRLAGAGGVGIDPELVEAPELPGVTFVRGFFPADLPPLADGPFEAATALAVVEHVPETKLATWAKVLAQVMVPNAVLVLTVPARPLTCCCAPSYGCTWSPGSKPTSTTDSSPATWRPSSPPRCGGGVRTAASSWA